MDYNNKILAFEPSLIPSVLDGSKTLTYRIGLKWDFLNIGDTILVGDSSNHDKPFAKVEITGKELGTFLALDDNRDGHIQNRTIEQRRADFKNYYGRDIADDEPALILEYSVVEII